MMLLLCLLKLQSFLLNARKKTPVLMTKLLNIIMPWVIPEDVIASGLEGDEGSETNYVYTRPTAGSI